MDGWSGDQCQAVLDMFLERVQFLHEIPATAYLFDAPDAYDEKLVRKVEARNGRLPERPH